jgi:hypothetical protein
VYSFDSILCSSDCAVLYFLNKFPTENIVFCFQECVFIGPLPSDGCPSIAESVISRMCLPSHCLATVIFFTIGNILCYTNSSSCGKGRKGYTLVLRPHHLNIHCYFHGSLFTQSLQLKKHHLVKYELTTAGSCPGL